MSYYLSKSVHKWGGQKYPKICPWILHIAEVDVQFQYCCRVKQKLCKKYVYKVDIFVTYRLFIQKLFPFSMFLVFNLYICVLQLLLYTFVAKDPLDFETLLYTRITTHIVLHINRAWHIIIKIFTVASFIFSLLKIRSKPPYGVIPCRNRIKKIHDNVRNYGLLVGSFRP